MNEGNLVNIPDFAHSLAPLPDNLIERDSSITTIESIFSSDVEAVFLQGNEGIGKTVVARCFVERNKENTISIFVRPIGSYTINSQVIIIDLCSQIYWALEGKRIPENLTIDQPLLMQYWARLARRSSTKSKRYNLVIDGLNNLDKDDYDSIESILSLFPIGNRGYKFLITGDPYKILSKKAYNINYKDCFVDAFSLDQTIRFLDGCDLDRKDIEEIHKFTKGVPAKLASARRLIEAGAGKTKVVERADDPLADVYEIEWQNNPIEDDDLSLLLALLAYDDKSWNCAKLSGVLNIETKEIEKKIKGLSFISQGEDGLITFAGDAFRRFASEKLLDFKNAALNIIIDSLTKTSDENDIVSLPSYLLEANRTQDIIKYLEGDNLNKLIKASKTTATIKRNLGIGFAAAEQLDSLEYCTAFSTSRSALSDLWTSDPWKNEINALLSLDRYKDALNIANSAVLAEDKLQLLCMLIRWKREKGHIVEDATLESIEEFYKQIDPLSIGYEKAIDIAGDMFTIYPDKAIELVTKSASIHTSENALDYALTKFSLVAVNRQESFRGLTDALEILRNKITSPKAANIFSIASTLIAPKDTKNVLAEISKLEKTSDKLLLLRQWVVENQEHEEIGSVIEKAIDLAISDTSYSPNAAFYRDLSEAVRYITDPILYKRIISLLDGQRAIVHEKGPTIDYIRFQLNLAGAELSKSKKEKGVNRYIEIYLEDIQGISELPIRANALAWYYSSIYHHDPNMLLDENEGIHQLVKSDIQKCVDDILESTADQYEILRGVFEALSPIDPKGACRIAESLNVQHRRDEATKDIITTLCESKYFEENNIKHIIDSIEKIQNRGCRTDATLSLLKGILDNEISTSHYTRLIEITRQIKEPVARCDAIIFLFRLCSVVGKSDDRAQIIDELENVWNSISSPWKKIEVGFDIACGLAEEDKGLANTYISRSDELRKRCEIETKDSYVNVKLLVNLLIQAFHGLLKCKKASEKESLSIARTIPAIPCPIEQAKLWGAVGCAYKLTGNEKELNHIVESKLIPSLELIDKNDESGLVNALVYCAPALWCSQRELCVEYLNNLKHLDRDDILNHVWRFISYKILPGLPYDETKQSKKAISYLEINEALAILRLVEVDSLIYKMIEDIADLVLHLKHIRSISKEQIADLSEKIIIIADEKLPSKNYIKHEGYLLASYAQCGRMRSEKNNQFWNNIIERTVKIPNLSDRALVYSFVASAIPNNLRQKKIELIDKARIDIDKIISEHDKLDRYESLAEVALDIDESRAKSILSEAFSSMTADAGNSIHLKRKRLIDLSYNIDPSLPASLSSTLDDDPARQQIKKQVKRVEGFNNVREEIRGRDSKLVINRESVVDYANAAWRQLASLNARRTSPIKIEKINTILKECMDIPITLAYPLFALCFESMNIHAKKTDRYAFYLSDTFQAINRTITFALGVLSHASSMSIKDSLVSESRKASNKMIEPGERESALNWIEDWVEKASLDEIYVCDPYLDLDGLEIINSIRSANQDIFLWVLADINRFRTKDEDYTSDDKILSYWRRNISDDVPKDIRIVLCGTESRKFPVHDRWILGDSSGLRIGTSYNSLGLTKLSEISEMSEAEVLNIRAKLERFFTGKELRNNSERLFYKIIDL